eukprot:TRINITY_DN6533_c0_g1_i2.p1 TRINITY_DN6533_c0_g1~~TRINITY_DN6533_c0_g1_i2.p1  ORF type:complete len:542 (-),score=44.64 TRINITY_DN6533_c0_g1_i2:327-1952(-)
MKQVMKILMYADDITLLLRDKDDIRVVFRILENFKRSSGLNINKTKSQAMWIGSNRHKTEQGFDVQWVKKIKILGIYFSSYCSASRLDVNWIPRIRNVKQLILSWEKRNLGLLGKICVIKTFLLSQFVFVMQSISIPEKVMDEINTIFFRFLWRKKDCNKKAFEKVKRCVVTSEIDKGGIKMIDMKAVQQSFLCEWLLKLAKAPDTCKWSWVPMTYFSNFGRNFACFTSTLGVSKFKGLENITSVFWKDAASVYLNNNRLFTAPNLKMECLWNNAQIVHQNNVILFKQWALQGITYVFDMLSDNRILTFDELKLTLRSTPSLYLEYMVVHSALLSFLTKNPDFHTDNITDNPQLLFNDCLMTKAKSFRTFMTEKRYSEPCTVAFWRNKFNITITKQHWTLPKYCTKESRIRELHWKILHNIYPTNILLAKMGITSNNKCPNCADEVDFIEHFFVKCKQVTSIWEKVKEVFFRKYHKLVHLNEINILLGIVDDAFCITEEMNYINNLILVAKMCISKFRYGTPIHLDIMFEKELMLRGLFVS